MTNEDGPDRPGVLDGAAKVAHQYGRWVGNRVYRDPDTVRIGLALRC